MPRRTIGRPWRCALADKFGAGVGEQDVLVSGDAKAAVPAAGSHTVSPILGSTIAAMTRIRWRGVRNCAARFC